MQKPRRHDFPRQCVDTRLQRRSKELIRLTQNSEKRDHQVGLTNRSTDRVKLFRQQLELVDMREHTITLFHHSRKETTTKKELVRKTLLLEELFQS